MRVSKEQLTYIRRAIEAATVDKPMDELQARYRLQGLSPRRFRWDCTYAAKLSQWFCDVLYADDMDDTHIDTALRAVMRDMGLSWAAQ